MKLAMAIGGLLKKNYRLYSTEILKNLETKGFVDLRASFLEILMYLCENEGENIKNIGVACGLKKQTMTSHLNELEARGYVVRVTAPNDKREQLVHLTEYGRKFKLALMNAVEELERKLSVQVGTVELERVVFALEKLYKEMTKI